VAITLPLSMKINTLSIILSLLIVLIDIIKEKNARLMIPGKYELLFIGYYLMILFTIIYTENIGEALKKLEYNSSFIVLPVFYYRIRQLKLKEYEIIQKLYVVSLLLTSIALVVIASFKYLNGDNSNVFFYHSLTSPLGFHAIFFSMYVVLGLILVAFNNEKTRIKGKAYIIIFFCFILILLSSKSIIIFTFLYFSVWLFLSKGIKRKKVILLMIISCFLLLTLGNGFFKDRFIQIFNIEALNILKEDSMTEFDQVNGLTLRLMFSKYAIIETIKNPFDILFGQGFGDKQLFLDSVYEKHNMAITIDGKKIGYYGYNLHNQYIETFVCAGLLGITYLVFLLIVLTKKFSSNKMAFSFGLLIVWSFLFESVIMVNKGIVFFVFWSLIFINIDLNEDSDTRNTRNT
tara:strand:- start:3512 stop:4723 length:1212 start_codon:yes stop_codon:yes gene_type:complete